MRLGLGDEDDALAREHQLHRDPDVVEDQVGWERLKSARLIIAIGPVMPTMPRNRDSCSRIQFS